MQTIEATIESIVKRGQNTVNGNARYTVEVLTSTEPHPGRCQFKVAPDSSLAIEIPNFVGDRTPRTFALNERGMLSHEVV